MSTCAIKHTSQGERRGVHFLDCPSIKHANGLREFEKLPVKAQYFFRTSFDYWNGYIINPNRFHGFEKSLKKGIYKDCFVFRHIERKCRLYGFLSHPESIHDTELCILVLFCQKKEDKTDETMLKRVNEIRLRPDVIDVLKKFRVKLKGR